MTRCGQCKRDQAPEGQFLCDECSEAFKNLIPGDPLSKIEEQFRKEDKLKER
jgi:hypothetical protein